jgi:hypothetical protein
MASKYIVAFGHGQPHVGDNARIPATMPILSAFLFFIFSLLIMTELAHAQTTPFYQGKTIRIIVGSTTGSLYDYWAHLLA